MPVQPDAFAALVLKKTGLFTDLQLDHVLAADRSDGTGITGVVVRLGLAREDEFRARSARCWALPIPN